MSDDPEWFKGSGEYAFSSNWNKHNNVFKPLEELVYDESVLHHGDDPERRYFVATILKVKGQKLSKTRLPSVYLFFFKNTDNPNDKNIEKPILRYGTRKVLRAHLGEKKFKAPPYGSDKFEKYDDFPYEVPDGYNDYFKSSSRTYKASMTEGIDFVELRMLQHPNENENQVPNDVLKYDPFTGDFLDTQGRFYIDNNTSEQSWFYLTPINKSTQPLRECFAGRDKTNCPKDFGNFTKRIGRDEYKIQRDAEEKEAKQRRKYEQAETRERERRAARGDQLYGERYGGFTIVYPENHSDLVNRKISNFTNTEIREYINTKDEKDIKLLNPLWDISFKGEPGEIIGKKEKLEKFFDDKGFTIEGTDVWETYKQNPANSSEKENDSKDDSKDDSVKPPPAPSKEEEEEQEKISDTNSDETNKNLDIDQKKPSKKFCDEGELDDGEKYHQDVHNLGATPYERCNKYYPNDYPFIDGIYHYKPRENNPFSNEELIVYVKETVQKKYNKEKYYVVFRTDGNMDPEFSLPLFMTEQEFKKNTFGTFKMIPKPNQDLVTKTKAFEDYLKKNAEGDYPGDGNSAINAIVNKKRVLGLSRMLVGNINKGGKRTRRKRNNKRKTKRRV